MGVGSEPHGWGEQCDPHEHKQEHKHEQEHLLAKEWMEEELWKDGDGKWMHPCMVGSADASTCVDVGADDDEEALLAKVRQRNASRQRMPTRPWTVAKRRRRERINTRLQELQEAMLGLRGTDGPHRDTTGMLEEATAYILSLRQ